MIGGIFPFKIENGAVKQIQRRFKSLTTFDEVRIMQIMESIQYGAIYFALGFITGTGLDALFPAFDKHKPIHIVLMETLGQAISMIILIFYIKKLVKLVPFFFVLNWDLNGDGKVSAFKPYLTSEYSGDIMIGVVLLGSQFNFINKIDLVSKVLYRDYIGSK
jgi:hypothetical protein